MAVFCLSVLLTVLAIAALVAARPWQDTLLGPSVSLAPDLGAALDEGVALSPSTGPALADARPVAAGGAALASTAGAPGHGEQASQVALAQARQVAQAVPSPTGERPPQSLPPEPAPATPAPVPVAVPVAAPSPQSGDEPEPEPEPQPAVLLPDPGKPGGGGGAHRPGTAGVDLGFPFAAFKVEEGEVYLLSASFQLRETTFPPPGDDNMLIQFNSPAAAAPSFGLQLWDDGLGGRGLWSSGEAMGGERFLAPLTEAHLLEIYFQASSEGAGFYLAFLDGEAIDARTGVSLIEPGAERATVEVGLFRDGEFLPAGREVVFAAASLADTPEPLLP